MPGTMLPECDITLDERRLYGRKLRGPQILLPEKPINRPRRHRSQKHPFHINPTALYLLRAAADKNRPRRAQCDELVSIHR